MRNPTTAAAAALGTDRARDAIAAGRTGEVIRIARQAAGLTQAQLGDLIHLSKSAAGRLEHGSAAATDITVLRKVAAVLGIPPVALGIAGPPNPATPQRTTVDRDGQEDPMRRRDLLQGMAGIAAALALPSGMGGDRPHISRGDVTACQASLDRLYSLDSEMGGGHVAAINEKLIARIRDVMGRAQFAPRAEDGLSAVLAGAMENAGWLAYDDGRHDDARRWWLECLHAADLGGHTPVKTVTLASMAVQACTLGRGGEAVQLAHAAARDTTATRKVQSLLAAREAWGHAVLGDRAAAVAGFTRAEQLLHDSPDDPGWVLFFGPADLASHRTQAAIRAGDLPEAERAARAAVGAPDAGRWPRNRAMYQARLGAVLAKRGAIDEAIHAATPAVAAAGTLASARMRDRVTKTVRHIAEHHTYRPAREFGQWAAATLGATA